MATSAKPNKGKKKSGTRQGRTRLSLDVTPETKEAIRALLENEKSGARSITELIQRSIALYDLFVELQSEKGRITLKYEDGTEEKMLLL